MACSRIGSPCARVVGRGREPADRRVLASYFGRATPPNVEPSLDSLAVDPFLEPPSEQAYVSAEQPPSREDSWFPAAHAHSCRTCHPRRAPSQGSPGSVGLTPTDPDLVVLPVASRLRRHTDFADAVRHGRRAARSRLVVHLLAVSDDCAPARTGFVVSRAVGGAVVRNRVRRQLRHLMAPRLAALPAGSRVVVRALPRSAGASSADLSRDLDAALSTARSTTRSTVRSGARSATAGVAEPERAS
jgi:ribonuclease P protein component